MAISGTARRRGHLGSGIISSIPKMLPRRLAVPLIAIVPPGQKRKALGARSDGIYVRR